MAYGMTLFMHVMAVIIWLGIGTVFQVAAERAARRNDEATIRQLVGLGELFGKAFFGTVTAVVLLSGVLMVTLSAWGFDDTFVIGGLVGILVSGALGGMILGPTAERLENRVRNSQSLLPEARSDLLRLRMAGRVDFAIMTLVVFLMTVKPGS